MTRMQACARWGMCLARLEVCRGENQAMRCRLEGPSHIWCIVPRSSLLTNYLVLLTSQQQKPVFKRPVLEICTGESEGGWLELEGGGYVEHTCYVPSGGWAGPPALLAAVRESWLLALASALDPLPCRLRTVVGIHPVGPPSKRSEVGSGRVCLCPRWNSDCC